MTEGYCNHKTIETLLSLMLVSLFICPFNASACCLTPSSAVFGQFSPVFLPSAPKAGKQWPKTALLGVRQHTEALKGQMKRDTNMRLRRGCGENKKQHYHQCHPVSTALAAARTATQESAFTATVDAVLTS